MRIRIQLITLLWIPDPTVQFDADPEPDLYPYFRKIQKVNNMTLWTGLYEVIRLCLVISIILSSFQEVKKTDANHVDTLVSKILFKT